MSIRNNLAAAAVIAATAGALNAQTVELTLEDAANIAAQEVVDGDPATAVSLAEQLIVADPENRNAWLILAAAQLRLGAFEDSRKSGIRAWELSTTDATRYEAARLIALAAVNEKRYTLAEFWLRRALTVAPSDDELRQTVRDASGVRRLNPWSTNIRFSFAPSNNVNGGADSEINVIDGVPIVGILSASAQALDGWLGLGEVSLSYRLRESQTSRTALRASASGRFVILSDDAQAKLDADTLDTSEAKDFSTARLQFGLSHDQLAEMGQFGLDANIGAYWSGAELDYTYLRLGADRTVSLDAANALRGSFFVEQRFDPDETNPEDRVYSVQGQYVRNLENRSQASATLAWSARRSDNVNDSYESWTLQFGYAHGSKIGPARLSGSIGYQNLTYDDYFVGFIEVPGGREDNKVFAAFEAEFTDYSYAGFAPLVRLNASTTDSNVSRFELEEFNIEFGLRSTF